MSGAASETPVHSKVASADANAAPPKKSSTPRKGKNLKESQRKDSDADTAIVAGGDASDTRVCSEVARAHPKASPPKKSSTPRKGKNLKEAQRNDSTVDAAIVAGGDASDTPVHSEVVT